MPGKRKSQTKKNAKAQNPRKVAPYVAKPAVHAGMALGGDTLSFGVSGVGDTVTVVGTATVTTAVGSSTAGNFAATELDLDPGNLPRLGDLSKGFTQYRYKEFQVEVVPLLGTAAAGVGGVTINYDATSTQPTSLELAGRNRDNVLAPVGLGARLRLDLRQSQLPWFELKGTEATTVTDRLVSQFKSWYYSEGLTDASPKWAVIRIGYRVDLKGAR